MRLVRVAEKKVKELSEMLQASLKAHDVERVQARIRRHNLNPAVSQIPSRAVTILNSSDIVGMPTHWQAGFIDVLVHMIGTCGLPCFLLISLLLFICFQSSLLCVQLLFRILTMPWTALPDSSRFVPTRDDVFYSTLLAIAAAFDQLADKVCHAVCCMQSGDL